MKPPRFDYVHADTIDDAVDALAAGGEYAKVLAGGQSLIPMLNFRLARPSLLVDISSVDLGVPRHRLEDNVVVVPATITHAGLLGRRDLIEFLPLLGECLPMIGYVAIRNRGTMGGSLAHADPLAELCTAAVALEAQIITRSPRGERVIDAEILIDGPLMTCLDADEIIVAIAWPAHREWGAAYEEFTLRAGDFAIIGVAALVRLDGDGCIEDARLAIAGLGGKPLRLREAEQILRGHSPSSQLINEAANLVAATGRPQSDIHASAGYRRALALELTRRALTRAIGQNRKTND